MATLELKGVSKGYGLGSERTHVLTDIELSIDKGEFVALVGYSGAGKTTLVSLIAGLLSPDTGSVHFDGKPVRGPGPDRGVVFQILALPWLTCRRTSLWRSTRSSRTSHQQRRDASSATWRWSPTPRAEAGQLSGGAPARRAVARWRWSRSCSRRTAQRARRADACDLTRRAGAHLPRQR
jgi:nitrate/nitrite transport system ATP-binding protein